MQYVAAGHLPCSAALWSHSGHTAAKKWRILPATVTERHACKPLQFQ